MKTKKILNQIFLANNVDFMDKMEKNSIDLIFADPPYNMQLKKDLIRYNGSKFNGVDDEWDKYNNLNEYYKEAKKWINSCMRILNKNGSLWVIGSFHNIHLLGYILQKMDAWIINEIVWEKTNPVPNFSGSRFVNSQETLLWVTKNKKSKFTFNYKTMKNINNGKQMKSVWKFSICNGKERLKDSNGKKVHSTQKPLALLERIILATSKYGDVVLDPFSGTGTTAHAAKKLGRNYIGIEKERKYFKHSLKRLKEVKETKEQILKKTLLDIKPSKVTFLQLIINNYLNQKKWIKIKNTNIKIQLNNLGKIKYNGKDYSPNQLLKLIFKKPTNSWDFLIYDNEPISKIRDKYRKEILNE